jgi:hypothetical protein
VSDYLVLSDSTSYLLLSDGVSRLLLSTPLSGPGSDPTPYERDYELDARRTYRGT